MNPRTVIRVIVLLALVLGGTGFLSSGQMPFGLAMYAIALVFLLAIVFPRTRTDDN